MRIRHAVRALLMAPGKEILLMELAFPQRKVWLTPGGGIEAGEDHPRALQRELAEETGLTEFEIGPQIWTRTHTFRIDGQAMKQHESYYLVPIERFEPSMADMPDEPETHWFQRFAWWHADDIAASGETFAPGGLAVHLRNLLEHGPPFQPRDISTQPHDFVLPPKSD